ncbi:RNA-dependent RNA polymerase [Hubei rhabdo-like virus 6]|uniref:Replicase n=1 Tax=Hubei rhabdo-like virus 6 TaxID=1923190 RepID=A0A1L3KN22_9MONO|nr:RNA-dependent RNA polymerase [Hubei rhabdo-like virus 6]APG78705.1 RNA-dependent RNA polymerase [Hubei rhabdo-like virus 6]
MDRQKRTYHQYSRHVTNALAPDKIEFYRNHPKYIKKRFPTLSPSWFIDLRSGIHNKVTIFPWIEAYIRAHEPVIDRLFSDAWKKIWMTVGSSLELQMCSLTNGLSNQSFDMYTNILNQLSVSEDLQLAAKTKAFIINLHREIEVESEKGAHGFVLPSLPNIEFIGDLIVLHEFPGGPIIITYQMLVNCMDKLEARFSWLFYILYRNIHPSQDKFNTLALFNNIYHILEDAYLKAGNESIRIFKLLEPLLVGISLQHLDPETHDHDFGELIRVSIKDDYPQLQIYIESVWRIGHDYLNKVGPQGIPYLIEQYGQEKLHNYPIVSISGGLHKMHKYGTSIRISADQAIRDIASNFKREYFVAYYEKHKVLPKVIDNWRLHPKIRHLINRGKPGSIRECYRIPNEAWFALEFDKNHDFNYYPQISDLLDDKAITPHLDHIYQLFAADALEVMNLRKPYTQENTRLILEILSRPIIDIKAFYDEVERLGHIPKNWAIIQLMAKERELKIEARTFSILTFECRMMASACERNIGDNILPLFKQQSMTLSGSELKHKMDILSTLPDTETHTWIVFHHDLQQWNYTFRSYQQSHIINVLCDLFGVNHYRYLMNIFTDSMLFSANKFTPPGFPGEFTTWDTHAGGNQGILQKLWTLITIVVIRNVMHLMDLDHRLTGSGDNQVLFVRLIKNPQLSEMINLIKIRLKEAFEDIGLALKLEETWTSRDLVCYQRKYYYKGILVPGGIKVSARAFSGSGDIQAGINSVVTTAINGGMGLTDQHSDPILGPAFAYIEIFTNLLMHKDWSKYIPREYQSLTVLSMLSSDFGFLPFIQLTGFLYAGHQDTLSESLALLKFIWDKKPEWRTWIVGALHFDIGSQDLTSKLQLVLDPTSINIDRPKLPEALVKDKVEEYLLDPSNVRNQQLRLMFSCSKKEDQLALAKELLNIRPLNLALIHSLFECSHIGSLLGTFSRFNKISSLVRLIGLNKTGNLESCFTHQVRRMDKANLLYFSRRLKQRVIYRDNFIDELVSQDPTAYNRFCIVNGLHHQCTFSARLFLISLTYGLGTEFVTGPYTPAPLEQLEFHDGGIPEEHSSCLIVNPSYNIPDSLLEMEQNRGAYNLYIGSRTADPVRSIKLTTLDGVEAGTAIKTLLKILAWMKSTSSDTNIQEFIVSQLSSRMTGLDKLIPALVPGTAGGCIDHRFGSPGTVMWAFSNSTSILSTWYQITSNHATALQRGEEDRFVFFQQLYHHIYSVLRFCTPYKNRFGVRIRLDHCSYLIPKSQFHSPPLYLPGQASLIDGLVLDNERKNLLQKEATHYLSVMSNTILYKSHGEDILTSVIGHSVAHQISLYSMGLEELNQESHRVEKNQTSINLTLMRKVPLNKLLTSIALHLASAGYFGRRITYRRLAQALHSRSEMGPSGFSIDPFYDVLQAIITSGKLERLIMYSRTSWNWNSKTSLHSLIVPFFKAMSRALDDWIYDNYSILVLVEVRQSQYEYKSLFQFLYYWDKDFKSLIQLNRSLEAVKIIEELNDMDNRLKVLLVTDVGIATEYGRRVLPDAPIQDSVNQIGRPDTPKSSPMDPPSSPPWILIKPDCSSNPETMREAAVELIDGRHTWNLSSKKLFHIAKWNKSSSSGKYKLNELLKRASLTLPDHSGVITLAEGAGSFLSHLLHILPKSLGIYNSKVLPDETPPAMAGLYKPPDLLCPCNISERVINLPEMSSTYGDLCYRRTWAELNTYVKIIATSRPISLLTLDMEYKSGESIIVLQHLIDWVPIWEPANVIVKITLEMLLDEINTWFSMICGYFREHLWLKPSFSNPYSTEVYLILTSYSKSASEERPKSLSTLISAWKLLPVSLTSPRIGHSIVEMLTSNVGRSFCPGYIGEVEWQAISKSTPVLHLLRPKLTYYFNAVYRRFNMQEQLDRTEQIILHSQSFQSQAIRRDFACITRAIILYIRLRGLSPSYMAHQSLLDDIRSHPENLHSLIEGNYPEITTEGDDRHVIQQLGLLLSYKDSLSDPLTVKTLIYWFSISIHDDKFFVFPSSTYQERSRLLQELMSHQLNQQLDTFSFIFKPASFYLINVTLVDYLEMIGWDVCRICAREENLTSLLHDLQWHPRLRGETDNQLVLVSLEDLLIERETRYNHLNHIIIRIIDNNENNLLEYGELALSRSFHEVKVEIYVLHL